MLREQPILSGEAVPAPRVPDLGPMVQAYRYRMLQAVSRRLDEGMRALAGSFLSGEEPHSVRVDLDADLSLAANVKPMDMAFFNVFQPATQDLSDSWPIGEFRLMLKNDGRFTLYDRLVTDDVRGRGIGSLLLHATERFVQMATPSGTEPCLRAEIGQGFLMDWFAARGYAAETAGALEKARADLASGALIVGQNGYLYAAGTPDEERVAQATKPRYRRRIAMAKRLTRDGSST